MKIISVFIFSSSLALAACVHQPTLEEKLQGRSTSERRAILEEECIKEATWQTPGRYGHSSPSHINRMKKICEEMSAEIKR